MSAANESPTPGPGRGPSGTPEGQAEAEKQAAPAEPVRNQKPGRPESPEKPRPGKAEKTEKAEKAEKPEKSEQTRALILQTAMELFQERGYDKTTMRAIAQEAGVSVGNAYYYFAGKEHLIQGFYDRIAAEHQERVRPILARETDLEARLSGVLQAWLDIAEPYHEFAAQFFKNAADPDSPLSPFSAESEHAREAAIDVHRETLAGASAKVPAELAVILPELMWLSQMGLVLYWVFDRSEGHRRSRRLADRGARLTSRGVALARFRVLRPLVREVHELFTDFLPGMTQAAPAAENSPTADGTSPPDAAAKTERAAKAKGSRRGKR
ncbi:TetR family transcriptional regulator [Streptomyces albus]|uniref:TetR family transcriptional regulator n=1 Tax=Streptomyces albus (strain ATCC 21838 / DSM 41398 / FERM P-419 / JCM 4703 / NBRC 107858) TaxID=1081613 RepID=A0A0B5F0M8_STRA4|nr:TetR family transcriptional regulator [Streptomyces albus]AOU79456.1 TetR family transcriptional regulator [Streptomyces albus]AYN35182.1 TetR family transcriptional regulator [Streptomyces albus]